MKALAQRYARALADVALEQNQAETVRRELADFAALLAGSEELRKFLATPAVPRPSKQAVIEKLAARLKAGKILRNFLLVLVDNRRAALLPEIQQAFEAQLLARQGVAQAQVTSARELSPEEKTQLLGVLSKVTRKKVEASYALDPQLIGGAVARVGSTVYDGSVREQLRRLRARLAAE